MHKLIESLTAEVEQREAEVTARRQTLRLRLRNLAAAATHAAELPDEAHEQPNLVRLRNLVHKAQVAERDLEVELAGLEGARSALILARVEAKRASKAAAEEVAQA